MGLAKAGPGPAEARPGLGRVGYTPLGNARPEWGIAPPPSGGVNSRGWTPILAVTIRATMPQARVLSFLVLAWEMLSPGLALDSCLAILLAVGWREYRCCRKKWDTMFEKVGAMGATGLWVRAAQLTRCPKGRVVQNAPGESPNAARVIPQLWLGVIF